MCPSASLACVPCAPYLISHTTHPVLRASHPEHYTSRLAPRITHPVSHTRMRYHVHKILSAVGREHFWYATFLGRQELHFPFLLYKIGARLLSKARMVQRLLLVSHSKWHLLKGPIHAIRFLNKTKFPAALDCLDKDHHSCSINAALDCWIIAEIAWKSPCYIKRLKE